MEWGGLKASGSHDGGSRKQRDHIFKEANAEREEWKEEELLPLQDFPQRQNPLAK